MFKATINETMDQIVIKRTDTKSVVAFANLRKEAYIHGYFWSFMDGDLTGVNMWDIKMQLREQGYELNLERAAFNCRLLNTDFSGMDLTGVRMGGNIVKNCKFEDCAMKRAYLSSALFSECNFRNADLEEATLSSATFIACTMTWTMMTNTDIIGAMFDECDLQCASFAGACYNTQSDWDDGAFFRKCNLIDCDPPHKSYFGPDAGVLVSA